MYNNDEIVCQCVGMFLMSIDVQWTLGKITIIIIATYWLFQVLWVAALCKYKNGGYKFLNWHGH